MKKIILLIINLLFCSQVFSIFDLSPWLIIDNKTPFNFVCLMHIVCYESDYEGQITTSIPDNSDEIAVQIKRNCYDEEGNEFVLFNININCRAESTIILDPKFYDGDNIFNPKIAAVYFTEDSLQIALWGYQAAQENRYFSIDYDLYSGITTTAKAIPIHIKCYNNFKQMVQSAIAAAVNATSWLPY
ncbi:hypothetical protein KBC04_00335 [Candidatus Babeliales bacterium]|nr:hypothetical protein [Candidatus Babeliales bacterium]MBP9843461.1 hypothetical protein [Candidatus Babeliales bacterium]